MEKKALSPVISVVLLVALVVAAIAVVGFAIIPMTEKKLTESTSCFDITGRLNIDETSGYTCFKEDSKEVQVTVRRGDINIKGISIAIAGGGSSKSFEIMDGENYSYIRMLDGEYEKTVELPGKGEERTYVFNVSSSISEIETASISGIIETRTCNPVDTKKLEKC